MQNFHNTVWLVIFVGLIFRGLGSSAADDSVVYIFVAYLL